MTERLQFHFYFHALEKEIASHSSVLDWRIPGTGEPGGLLSMGSQRIRHDLATKQQQSHKAGKWQTLESHPQVLPLTSFGSFQDPSKGFSRNCDRHYEKAKVQNYMIHM